MSPPLEDGEPCNDKDLRTSDQQRAAPGAADDSESGLSDPDLRAVMDAWPTLSDPVKAGILAMVDASVSGDGTAEATAGANTRPTTGGGSQ